MKPVPPIKVAIEGLTDEVIIRRVLAHLDWEVGDVFGRKGKAALLRKLDAYSRSSRFMPWLVVVDLDEEDSCAANHVQRLWPNPSDGLVLRIAVQAIESWLLADAMAIARFLHIREAHLPNDPDRIPNPKRALVDLARTSRSRAIRDDMAPRPASGRDVGPGYVSRIAEFAEHHWRPDVARQSSESFSRCVRALHRHRAMWAERG